MPLISHTKYLSQKETSTTTCIKYTLHLSSLLNLPPYLEGLKVAYQSDISYPITMLPLAAKSSSVFLKMLTAVETEGRGEAAEKGDEKRGGEVGER